MHEFRPFEQLGQSTYTNMPTLTHPFQAQKLWTDYFKSALTQPLLSNDNKCSSNINFICSGTQHVTWNGLAYLGSLSTLFRPRSGEEQSFTVIAPDHDAALVRKLLLLLCTGEASVQSDQEVNELHMLANDLGVSSLCNFFVLYSTVIY